MASIYDDFPRVEHKCNYCLHDVGMHKNGKLAHKFSLSPLESDAIRSEYRLWMERHEGIVGGRGKIEPFGEWTRRRIPPEELENCFKRQ